MNKRTTLRDVANAVNLSPTSVSIVLSGRPNHLSPESRTRILEAADRLMYKPGARKIGRPPVDGHFCILVILPDIHNSFFTDIAGGADAFLTPLGHRIELAFSDNNSKREMELIQRISKTRIDGLIIATTMRFGSDIYEQAFKETGVPVVIADRVFPTLNCSSISYNHKKGAYLATEHLLSLGHRRIACLIGNSYDDVQADPRYAGYLWAYEEADLVPPSDGLFLGNYLAQAGYEAAEKILSSGFTALFSCNDIMVYGFLKRAREVGMSVPQDISVVGYDDLFFSNLVDPPLTTIRQCPADIGNEAARHILREIEEPHASRQTVFFEPKLTLRDSTRPFAI